MEYSQLVSVMKFYIGAHNKQKVAINQDTIHGSMLSETDGPPATAKIYKQNVKWTFDRAKVKPKTWPGNWLDLTIRELAQRLLPILILLFTTAAKSQLIINAGSTRTDLKNAAIQIGFTYLKSLDSTISNQEFSLYGKNSWFVVTPDIEFRTGTSDAFSSIIVKASGLFSKFRVTTVDGLEAVDINKTMHIFPVSFGAESNNRFDFVNGMLEIGYTPFYQSMTRSSPDFIKKTRFGIYLQGGYKFKLSDSVKTAAIGGQVDESEEDLQEGILRAKGNFSIDAGRIVRLAGFQIGLIGNSNAWYDLLHQEFYYQLQGVARFYLTDNVYFDLTLDKGSGAPLFNNGKQYGAGLTLKL